MKMYSSLVCVCNQVLIAKNVLVLARITGFSSVEILEITLSIVLDDRTLFCSLRPYSLFVLRVIKESGQGNMFY
jgi:hypothetical protein